MPRPQYDFDWQSLVDDRRDGTPASSPRNRLRWILACYAAALAVVLLRAVQLELQDGENFRRLAARPWEKTLTVAAPRGRIMARDGTVLATDQQVRSLAMHYRYLQSPPDSRWLRRRALARLTRAERRDARRVAAAERVVRDELADLHRRLAALCHIDNAEWQARAARIQVRVAALAELVNRRRLERFREQTSTLPGDSPLGVLAIASGLFSPPERLPPAEVVVAEQVAYHRLVDDLPPPVCQTIESQPDAFPGVKIIEHARRNYPHGSLAANVVGHVGSADDDPAGARVADGADASLVGRMGFERACETKLRGTPGRATEFFDARGELLSTRREQAPLPGSDVVLTLDPALQHFAEQLLDRAAHRDAAPDSPRNPQGGAIVVMDVRSGDVLTAASEPRFDPNWFAPGDARAEVVLALARQPLFDRAAKMAIPPGSVFKPLAALALLEQGVVDPQETFHCQGFLDDPHSMRCQLFRRQGIGHGDVTLAGALAQSCNVYFFHHATRLGAAPLVEWAARFGFGQPAAGDLGDQAVGQLPAADELSHAGRLQMLAIGQGMLTATPLQVARFYAAIANGGYLVAARFTHKQLPPKLTAAEPPPTGEPAAGPRIAGIDETALAAVREGLRRVVDDPTGTAHQSVHVDDVPIAGKTGTAETGGGADHAWFAGYVPADAPRFAFVVALEHGGSGAESAGTIARSLVLRMRQLGYFPAAKATTAERPFPPGKG
jgi:penicillin-binding protein 2